MTAQEVWQPVRVQLEAKREELKKSLAALGFPDPARVRPNETVGRAGRLLAEYGEIELALARIAKGRYGVCEQCQKAISRVRLLAMPAAPLCLECASGLASDDLTAEHDIEGATELNIRPVTDEDDAEAHTVQVKIPDEMGSK